jgi:hypothetical protein
VSHTVHLLCWRTKVELPSLGCVVLRCVLHTAAAQEILHVLAPHYLHMFEAVFSRPRPWVFGHL